MTIKQSADWVISGDSECLTLKSMNFVASECAQWSAVIHSWSNRKFLAGLSQIPRLTPEITGVPIPTPGPRQWLLLFYSTAFNIQRRPMSLRTTRVSLLLEMLLVISIDKYRVLLDSITACVTVDATWLQKAETEQRSAVQRTRNVGLLLITANNPFVTM